MDAKLDPTPGDLDAFCADPAGMLDQPADEIYALSQPQIDQIQLAVVRRRFEALVPKLPPLKRLAEVNHITDISELNALVPLLFPHTAYKSYPLSLIDNARFAQLTHWLNDYTVHDLSGLDVSRCETLDEWLDVIEAKTPVRVVTSSGTSGKLSLIPKSTEEVRHIPGYFRAFYSPFGAEFGADPFAPQVFHVSPHVPKGRHNSASVTQNIVTYAYGGDRSRFLTPEGEMSTDLLWMSGRIKRAQADGALEALKKTKAWKRLAAAAAAHDVRKAQPLDDFYVETLKRLKGETVFMRIGLNYLADMVRAADAAGLEIDLAPGSSITLAGGLKGAAVTDEQLATVRRAIRCDMGEVYACSELMSGLAKKCPHGHYHAPPWLVSYVLDPDTGAPYPRRGEQTGRYAGFDLMASTYWGGFITGDEVTINWDGGCGCGRSGPYMHGAIVRYADKNGGDDKITCQRTAAAIEDMMQHLQADTAP